MGAPITVSLQFDLEQAIDAAEKRRVERGDPYDSDLSDLSDLSDPEDDEDKPVPPRGAPLSAPAAPNPSNKRPASEKPDKVNKRRKTDTRHRRKRKGARLATQQAEGTRLKGISKKKAAKSTPANLPDIDVSDLPHASTAWIGLKEQYERSLDPLAYLTGPDCGMTLVEHDGLKSRPLVDRQDRVVGVVLGKPADTAGWDKAMEETAGAVRDARKRMRFSKGMQTHRRGAFPAVGTGISFGGGQGVSQLTIKRRPGTDASIKPRYPPTSTTGQQTPSYSQASLPTLASSASWASPSVSAPTTMRLPC